MKKILIIITCLVALPITAVLMPTAQRSNDSCCPSCKKIFGFLRRKHRCNLCDKSGCAECIKEDSFTFNIAGQRPMLRNIRLCSQCTIENTTQK